MPRKLNLPRGPRGSQSAPATCCNSPAYCLIQTCIFAVLRMRLSYTMYLRVQGLLWSHHWSYQDHGCTACHARPYVPDHMAFSFPPETRNGVATLWIIFLLIFGTLCLTGLLIHFPSVALYGQLNIIIVPVEQVNGTGLS